MRSGSADSGPARNLLASPYCSNPPLKRSQGAAHETLSGLLGRIFQEIMSSPRAVKLPRPVSRAGFGARICGTISPNGGKHQCLTTPDVTS